MRSAIATLLLLTTASSSEAAGPRPLPSTRIALELDAFARPAQAACADNKTVVRVARGQSIAAALATARPGTTIEIAAGSYTEQPGDPYALVWSTPNVCLRAAGEVILTAARGQKYGLVLTGDDNVVEGITMRGFRYFISVGESEGKTQRRVTLERLKLEQPAANDAEGIIAYGDNAGGAPVLDGLLLLDITTGPLAIGVSCNAGPCTHWWLERVAVRGRRGDGGSGADAFAIERGRQIVVVDSSFTGFDADGIDTKADDVIVSGTRVVDVGRNGIKLWRGGDVLDSVVDGSGADAALVGDGPGVYRYQRVRVTRYTGGGYVGWWGYDAPTSAYKIEIEDSVFSNVGEGGFFFPAPAKVWLRHNVFAPGKLIELSDGTLVPDPAAITATGRGSDNRVQ